jgi:general secretion pathway protein G
MVKGVSVIPLAAQPGTTGKSVFEQEVTKDSQLASTKKKVYLRSIPLDPMTGEADWDLRSTYDSTDATSWGGENVFDVRSKSKETALDGTKYNEW